MKFSLPTPAFMKRRKKEELKQNSDQNYQYWRQLFEEAKLRKLHKNMNSIEFFIQKYFPHSEIEDEDDFVSSSDRICKSNIEDKESCEDTISWKWIDVSEDESNQNISHDRTENISINSNSSQISGSMFLRNDFYCSTMNYKT